MKSSGTSKFWRAYSGLPEGVRAVARKNYQLWLSDPKPPSLHFKKIGGLWSIRVGIGHRALAVKSEGGFCWVWIGSHADYDDLIRGQR